MKEVEEQRPGKRMVIILENCQSIHSEFLVKHVLDKLNVVQLKFRRQQINSICFVISWQKIESRSLKINYLFMPETRHVYLKDIYLDFFKKQLKIIYAFSAVQAFYETPQQGV